MGALYLSGLRGAAHRWAVVLSLFLMSIGFALAFGGLAWFWLSLAFDGSLATRTLLRDLDPNVFVDLVMHHGDSLQMLLAAGVLLLGAAGFVWVWLHAVAVVAVVETGDWGMCTRRAIEVYPAFVRLWLLASAATGATVLLLVVLGRLALRWTAESQVEMTAYWILLALLAGGGLALLFLSTVHDHARIHAAATGAGALRGYLWAIGFVGYRSRLALPLAALLTATVLVVMLVYSGIGALIPKTSVPGVVLSLVWGELMLLSRSFTRVWFFAAEAELQSASDVADAGS
jgi:hypothetical protein